MLTPNSTFQAFAEQILYSSDLEAKLKAPNIAELTDDNRLTSVSFKAPLVPSRSEHFKLDQTKSDRTVTFPTRSQLSNDRARGLILHFFANHELLALELMALALLKWPEAPKPYRSGLLQTMVEEQSHMILYLNRMKDLGVAFGEAPLNSFFWKSMRDLHTVTEFAAAMSLTFEQANIDFAHHFEHLFANEGDRKTAEIMKQVRLDEIGHVKHGLIWFERWRPKAQTLFSEWHNSLTFPLTPARAKGTFFDRDGRIKAGLPIEFIDELEVHNQSKGRPPRVFLFNPGCEQEIEAGHNSWTPPKAIRALERDYAILMALLANPCDIVLVHDQPQTKFLRQLSDFGMEVPEFVTLGQIQALKLRKFTSFEPWGQSPHSNKVFNPFESLLVKPLPSRNSTPSDAPSSIFSKSFAKSLRTKLNLDDMDSKAPQNFEDVKKSLSELRGLSPSKTVVFKAPFSASGRGMIRVLDESLSTKDIAWIQSVLNRHGHVIAEPWLDKMIDISTHIDIEADGTIKWMGTTRFWTDLRGQYRGHFIGRLFDDLGPQFLAKWHEDLGWKSQLQSMIMDVGRHAYLAGYYGPLGVDSLIYMSPEGPKLRPLVEINPRWSMGRIAMALSKHISTKQSGIWIHVSQADLKRSNIPNFVQLCSKLSEQHPSEFRSQSSVKFIAKGVVPINDPEFAEQAVALLIVGRHHQECYDVLLNGGLNDPQLAIQIQAGRNFHSKETL